MEAKTVQDAFLVIQDQNTHKTNNTERTHYGKYCFGKTPMQTFIEGITVARKYQLQNHETIQPNETDKIPFGCEGEESYVTSDQTSDTFLSDIKTYVRIVLTITGNRNPDRPRHVILPYAYVKPLPPLYAFRQPFYRLPTGS